MTSHIDAGNPATLTPRAKEIITCAVCALVAAEVEYHNSPEDSPDQRTADTIRKIARTLLAQCGLGVTVRVGGQETIAND